MANAKLNGERHKYASIDTAPAAAGYWSDTVSTTTARGILFFSQSGGGTGTVTIQYKLPYSGAPWVDYTTTETLEDGVRLRLADQGAGVKWRAGIKQAGLSAGTVICGFDY